MLNSCDVLARLGAAALTPGFPGQALLVPDPHAALRPPGICPSSAGLRPQNWADALYGPSDRDRKCWLALAIHGVRAGARRE
jgi:hypothetical protein